MCGANGLRCGDDLCSPILAVTCVVAFISSTINPPSTNSWIVCCRKDRGGCSCPCRWLCSVHTFSGITMCQSFEVVLVALSGDLWGYLGEVLRGGRGFLDSFLVSEQFADGSYLRGCQVLFR